MFNMVDFLIDVPVGREPVILQLTDPQIIDSSQQRSPGLLSEEETELWAPDKLEERCFKYIRETIEQTKPDLILVTGDQIHGSFDDNGSMLLAFIEFMESFSIPWAPVNGNHDPENNMGIDWQSEQYEKAEHCLFKQNQYYDGKVIMGNGNYTVGITQGGKLTRVFFMMDSNAYDYCDKIKTINDHSTGWVGLCGGQEEWCVEKIKEIKAASPDTKITFAFHVQFFKFTKVFSKYGFTGEEVADGNTIIIDEHPQKSEGDFGFIASNIPQYGRWDPEEKLVNKLVELGVDSFLVGHLHVIAASVVYEGVRYQFGLKSSEYVSFPTETPEGKILRTKYHFEGKPLVGGTVMKLAAEGEIYKAYNYVSK